MILPYSYLSHSVDDTHALALKWITYYQSIRTHYPIVLSGVVGAGKSIFVSQCLAIWNLIGTEVHYTSPSFQIIHEYPAPVAIPDKQVYHIDLYRIQSPRILEYTEFYDIINNHICFIEWPERIEWNIPTPFFILHFEIQSEHQRTITCKIQETSEI